MKWNPDNWNQIKIKLIAQPSAATRVLFFSVRKKKLFVAKRCHMAEGCQTNPECFAGLWQAVCSKI